MAKKPKNGEPPYRPYVYLVWALSDVSHNQLANLSLRAVYTEDHHEYARLAMRSVKEERNNIRCWIERRECNHFFGQQMITPSSADEK